MQLLPLTDLNFSLVNLIDLHYRNQTSLTGGIINQSLYGGAPIYISASGGIEMDPPQNLVTLTSANYLPAELPFYPPQVSGKFEKL